MKKIIANVIDFVIPILFLIIYFLNIKDLVSSFYTRKSIGILLILLGLRFKFKYDKKRSYSRNMEPIEYARYLVPMFAAPLVGGFLLVL